MIGILPAVENMPSGKAYKPGDVLKTMSGRTIEVLNTDAEGRLILADAIHYATTLKPELIVDVATLTGACSVAVGNRAIAMMGTDRTAMDVLKEAGEQTGERVWELPLWEEYEDLIKSDVADCKNIGDRSAGTIVGDLPQAVRREGSLGSPGHREHGLDGEGPSVRPQRGRGDRRPPSLEVYREKEGRQSVTLRPRGSVC